MEIKISQSSNKHGPYKWYWFYTMETGHTFHISKGYTQIESCIQDLKLNFNYVHKLAQKGGGS